MGTRRRTVMLGMLTLTCAALACSNASTLLAARGYTLIGTWQSPDPAKFFSSQTGTLLIVPCLKVETGPVVLDDSLSFATVGAVVYATGLEVLKVGDTVTVAGVAASHTLNLTVGGSAHYTMKTAPSSLSKNNFTCNQ